jgi:hypothetical protein
MKGGNNPSANPFIIGSNTNDPIGFETNNIQRMTILGGGPTDGGFIGINTNNPQFRLHINADNTGLATSQGWRKGILLSNDGALMWQGNPSPGGSTGTSWNYFMAHASNSPVGDFYQGMSQGIGSSAPVVYSSKVYASGNFNNNPQGTAHFFKHVLVEESGFERRVGINTTTPARVMEVRSNLTTAPQVRITTTNNQFSEIQTLTTGNMLLLPNAGRVGVNVPAGTNPTHNLQVNGTVRVQNLPVSTPNCLIVGTNQGNAQDNQMSQLDFTGNANQVLLGNGTWGAAPSTSEAHNGLSRSTLDPTRIALGQNEGQLFNPARFLNNREVPLNGYNLRISTLQPGQAGQCNTRSIC